MAASELFSKSQRLQNTQFTIKSNTIKIKKKDCKFSFQEFPLPYSPTLLPSLITLGEYKLTDLIAILLSNIRKELMSGIPVSVMLIFCIAFEQMLFRFFTSVILITDLFLTSNENSLFHFGFRFQCSLYNIKWIITTHSISKVLSAFVWTKIELIVFKLKKEILWLCYGC